MAEIIPIFAGLRSKYARGLMAKGSNRDALFIEFTAPDLVAVLDDEWLSAYVAIEIAETIKDNVLNRNLTPTGQPMPRVKASTEERREYREEQADRGGDAHPKYRKNRKSGKARAYKDARKNFKKRYTAQRLDGTFWPGSGRFPPNGAGRESGLLFASTASGRIGPGRWGVFFANVRALQDESGSSALGRVAKRFPLWDGAGMRQERIQRALRLLAKGILTNQQQAQEIVAAVASKDQERIRRATERAAKRLASRSAGDARRFVGALSDTVKSVFSLGNELSEFTGNETYL